MVAICGRQKSGPPKMSTPKSLELPNILFNIRNHQMGLRAIKTEQEKQLSVVGWSSLEGFIPWKSSNGTTRDFFFFPQRACC